MWSTLLLHLWCFDTHKMITVNKLANETKSSQYCHIEAVICPNRSNANQIISILFEPFLHNYYYCMPFEFQLGNHFHWTKYSVTFGLLFNFSLLLLVLFHSRFSVLEYIKWRMTKTYWNVNRLYRCIGRHNNITHYTEHNSLNLFGFARMQ